MPIVQIGLEIGLSAYRIRNAYLHWRLVYHVSSYLVRYTCIRSLYVAAPSINTLLHRNVTMLPTFAEVVVQEEVRVGLPRVY